MATIFGFSALSLPLDFRDQVRRRFHLIGRHANDHFLFAHQADHLTLLRIENHCHLRRDIDARLVTFDLHRHLTDGAHSLNALDNREIGKSLGDRDRDRSQG